ncbi:MATE family efflux transporter [uncultured Olegusella sp.]|uniref:MATE family efflux transporter n=1 Tax=uncultured Olegusella sp. TaxID=1979846 RepID=UPI002633775F|nr:MATE family efflux transporter [uncultured Olegusella sp.]
MFNNLRNMDMTTGRVVKRLVCFFLPILAGSLFQQLYTTADAVILGQYAGKIGLASIDAIYNLLKLPVNFFVGLSTGATILISQFFGAKDEHALSKVIHTGICSALAGGVVLSIIGVSIAPLCLKAMAVPKEIFSLSLSYVRVIFGGLALSMVYNIGAGILRAVGDSKTPFYILVTTGCVNIILDLVFVAIFKMNAPGAALATVFSQGLSATLVLVTLFNTKAPYHLMRRKLKADRKMLISICKLGLPIGLQSALYPVANMMVQTSINSTGTDNIAAWALCGKLDFMIWLITDSLAAAIATFVAQNYGAKAILRARHGIRVGLAITLGAIAVISLILFFWSIPIGKLFINAGDVDIAVAAGSIMRFLAPLYILYVFGEVLAGAIRGLGETLRPMLITMAGTCVTRILWIIFIVPLRSDLFTILGCYPLSWAVTSLSFVLYYLSYSRKKITHENESFPHL